MTKGLPPLLVALSLVACSSTSPVKPLSRGDVPNVPCGSSNVCRMWGWCGEKNNECVPQSDQSCRASISCKTGGLCSFDGNKCLAKTSDDCSGSEWCQDHGMCSAREGVCK